MLRQSLHSGMFAALAATVAVTLVSQFWNRGFDLYHQGLMLSTAIGVKEGLPIHASVFSQYGPITAWSQAVFLNFSQDQPAIALNYWSIAVIGFTVFLFTLISLVSPARWALDPRILGGIGVFWVTLSPAFTNGEILAWSSLLANLTSTLLIFQLLALDRFRAKFERLRIVTFSLWLIAGTTAGLMPFIRINVGIPLVIGISGWLLLKTIRQRKSFIALSGFVLGELFSAGLVFLKLFLDGSAGAYLNQSVLGPLSWASDVGMSLEKTFEEVIEELSVFAERSLPLIAFSLALVWLARRVRTTRLNKRLVIFLALLVGTSGWLYATQLHRHSVRWDLNSSETQNLLAEASGNLLWLTLFLGGLVGLLGIAVTESLRISADRNFDESPIPLVLIVSFSNLFQIWPTLAPWQVWWAILPLLVLIPVALKPLGTSASVVLFLPALLLSMALALSHTAVGGQSSVQTNFQATLANGLRVDDSTAIYIESTSALLRRIIRPGEEVFVLTYSGSEAAFHREFIAVNNQYVTWRYSQEVLRDFHEWGGKSIIDATALRYLEVSSFAALESRFGVKAIGCSDEPLPGLGFASGPFICVMERLK